MAVGSQGHRLLLNLVAKVAESIPVEILTAVAKRLREPPPEGTNVRDHALAALAQGGSRARVAELLHAWELDWPGGRLDELAMAIDAAAATHDWHRRHQSLELVWTGPAPHGTSLRRTDQALLELIRGARERLLIVTFAAYRFPVLHQALVEAADRHVAIDFVLESRDESQGKVSVDPIVAIGPALAERASVWTWPLEERPKDERGRHGALHAKCALADGARLFISSANLTADAMLLNMELGLLVEGGRLPGEVHGHFEALKANGVLRR